MAQIIHMIDPRRITERVFGGPHFGVFYIIGNYRVKCCQNGDVFDTRGLNDAWMESRNLAPIIYGDNRPTGQK